MNCKHCNAELGENSKFCANCGKPVEDTTAVNEGTNQGPEIIEKKKMSAGKIALAVVAVVVVLAVLVAVIAVGMNVNKSGTDETVAPEETVAATIPADGNPDDVTCKGSYSAADEDVIAARDTVVATMGDAELTIAELQVYYWTEFVYFMQEYSYYASYFGLDYTQPLDTQTCTLTEEPMTWQQYFLSCALDTWQSYQAMALEAEANSMVLSDDLRAELDALPDNLSATAVEYGLADAEELMKNNFGAGATLESYLKYWELYYNGWMYYDNEATLAQPTLEEIETYFAENEATYAESGITKDAGKYVDVRHILIMPEGGTYDEETYTTTYSEEEWAAAETKAQEIYDQWKAGEMTEESFAALANEYSADSDGTDGGLYENVYVGQMMTNFNDWCFDESRQIGDHDIVKTEYGYHIMYFSGSRDIWYYTAETDLLNSRLSNVIPDALEKYDIAIDYSKILLGNVELN